MESCLPDVHRWYDLLGRTKYAAFVSRSPELRRGIPQGHWGPSTLHPHAAVQRAISHRLGDVLGLDLVVAFEVGDGAGDAEDLVVGSGRQPSSSMAALRMLMASGLSLQRVRTWRGVIRPLTWTPVVAEPLGLAVAGGQDLGAELTGGMARGASRRAG